MLPILAVVPNTDDQWNQFSFNLRNEIDRINAAIQTQYNVNLPSYQLDPIPWDDVYTWLLNNSQAHIAFNDVLGLQSQDLLAVDLSDIRQRAAWIFTNFLEVQSAEQKLGI